MIKYKKLRDDSWGVIGPADELGVGLVTVTKSSGEQKQESVRAVSKPFNIQGRQYVIGFLVARGGGQRSYGGGYQQGRYAPGGRTCPQCGSRECPKAWSAHDLCDED